MICVSVIATDSSAIVDGTIHQANFDFRHVGRNVDGLGLVAFHRYRPTVYILHGFSVSISASIPTESTSAGATGNCDDRTESWNVDGIGPDSRFEHYATMLTSSTAFGAKLPRGAALRIAPIRRLVALSLRRPHQREQQNHVWNHGFLLMYSFTNL